MKNIIKKITNLFKRKKYYEFLAIRSGTISSNGDVYTVACLKWMAKRYPKYYKVRNGNLYCRVKENVNL